MGQSITFGYETYFATTGNDSTGDGTPSNPFRTLAKALQDLADFSQASTPPWPNYQYYILRAWGSNGVYAESVDSSAQPFPGDPRSIVLHLESVEIRAMPGETITLRPGSGTNVLNLSVNTASINNPSVLIGASCFITFDHVVFDGVNVGGDAVVVGGSSHDCTFNECEAINAPTGGGFVFDAGTSQHYLKNCRSYSNASNGISDAGTDNTVQSCESHDNTGDGIIANGTQTGTSNLAGGRASIERNRCYVNSNGISSTSGSALVRNNICYTNTASGINASSGKIYNNTCWNNTSRGISAIAPADPQNNICFGNSTDAIGLGSGNLDDGSDPLFVDTSLADFHLSIGSPAIDIGNSLTDVPGDADLFGRPAGAAYDAGAYEFPVTGTVVAITNLDTHFALATGRSCLSPISSPMDYRVVQATPKSYTGTPQVGIAICVHSASTPASFTGYVFTVKPQSATTVDFRFMRYDAQPLTGLGTVLFQQLGVLISGQPIIGQVMTWVAGTNTLNSTNDLWANIYEATNTILGGVDGAPLPRTNLGFGVVGIGSTVSIVVSGDDLVITTEDGTFTLTRLQAGCMNSPTNIAAFEQTFTFNQPISYNKTSFVHDAWDNYGIQTTVDVDVLCHCDGTDCYGMFWNSCYDYLEINPQGGDGWGDGVEFYFEYGGIIAGTPITGGCFMVKSQFTNLANAICYAVIIDEIQHTLEVVRWENQSVQRKGTILATIPWTAAAGDGFLVWLINDGSIRQAGDPAEIYVFHSSDGGNTFPTTLIDALLVTAPFGEIVEAPMELLKWKNTNAGLVAVGTQTGNPLDKAHYQNYMSIDQIL